MSRCNLTRFLVITTYDVHSTKCLSRESKGCRLYVSGMLSSIAKYNGDLLLVDVIKKRDQGFNQVTSEILWRDIAFVLSTYFHDSSPVSDQFRTYSRIKPLFTKKKLFLQIHRDTCSQFWRGKTTNKIAHGHIIHIYVSMKLLKPKLFALCLSTADTIQWQCRRI